MRSPDELAAEIEELVAKRIAAELDALRAVAEAAVPFAAHAASIDAQADAGDLPRWRDDAPVSGFTLGQCRAVLAALDRAREAGR